jgi:hypothetical protein
MYFDLDEAGAELVQRERRHLVLGMRGAQRLDRVDVVAEREEIKKRVDVSERLVALARDFVLAKVAAHLGEVVELLVEVASFRDHRVI